MTFECDEEEEKSRLIDHVFQLQNTLDGLLNKLLRSDGLKKSFGTDVKVTQTFFFRTLLYG